MTPVAAPPRVRDRLRAAPDGPVPVLHHGPHAVYVDVGGWAVGVVGPRAAWVPCAMRATEPLPQTLSGFPESAYLEGGTLHVGNRSLPIGRLAGTRVPRLDGAIPGTETNPATVQATPPATVAGFVAAHVPTGRLDASVAAGLVGRGEGLTPLGDDVLCGWLALHRAVDVATDEVDDVVRRLRGRTTLLSATLLDCAMHGEVLPEFAAWVRALGTAEQTTRAAALDAVGATSGAGLRAGAQLALTQLDLQEAAA